VFSAGEEIGWRGYMLTRLIDAGIPRPILVGGFIWALWHVPLILSGQYASSSTPALSAMLFVVDIVAGSYLFAWLRLSSGSVWPPILAHASWNAVIQNVFDAYTRGTSLWVGESGILVALIEIAVAIALTRRAWVDRRHPLARS
jgi:membrane protease YdiL (CAAX protease family)